MSAANDDWTEGVRALLQAGAAVKAEDGHRRTAMAYATRTGAENRSAAVLREHGGVAEPWHEPAPPTAHARPMGLGERLGCLILVIGVVVLVGFFLWFRYC